MVVSYSGPVTLMAKIFWPCDQGLHHAKEVCATLYTSLQACLWQKVAGQCSQVTLAQKHVLMLQHGFVMEQHPNHVAIGDWSRRGLSPCNATYGCLLPIPHQPGMTQNCAMSDWSQNDDAHAHVVMHIICVMFVMLVTSGHMAPPPVSNRPHHD